MARFTLTVTLPKNTTLTLRLEEREQNVLYQFYEHTHTHTHAHTHARTHARTHAHTHWSLYLLKFLTASVTSVTVSSTLNSTYTTRNNNKNNIKQQTQNCLFDHYTYFSVEVNVVTNPRVIGVYTGNRHGTSNFTIGQYMHMYIHSWYICMYVWHICTCLGTVCIADMRHVCTSYQHVPSNVHAHTHCYRNVPWRTKMSAPFKMKTLLKHTIEHSFFSTYILKQKHSTKLQWFSIFNGARTFLLWICHSLFT